MSGLIVHTERGDADEGRDLELANAISAQLQRHYPNHYWLVSFTGHALVIRHVLIANLVTWCTRKEGFGALLPLSRMGTVHDAESMAVRFGGQLLEAFGLRRGPWDGVEVPKMPADLLGAIRSNKQLKGWR